MPLKLTNEKIAEICKLYVNTQLSCAEIAKETGVCLSSVNTYVRKHFTNAEARRARGIAIGTKKNTGTFRVSDEKVQKAAELMRTTDLGVMEIAKRTQMTGRTMRRYVYPLLGSDFVNARYNRLRDSFFERHSGSNNNFYKTGRIVTKDSHGMQYIALLKPAWYSGKGFSNDGYVREHILNACKALGISELPKDFVVHHCDGNTMNNSFDNLVVLPSGMHTALHMNLIRKSATTISKESTLKWLAEARGFTWKNWVEENSSQVKLLVNDDMVCSTQECVAGTPGTGLNTTSSAEQKDIALQQQASLTTPTKT